MNIVINNSNLYVTTECDSINEIKEKIYIYVSEQLCSLLISDKIINTVYIISDTEDYYAKVEPISNEPIICNIVIHEAIILYLFRTSTDKKQYAESIIMHELYHCKENTCTFAKLDYFKICFDPLTYNDLCSNIGFHQWSEYYAYFYSAKISISNIKDRTKFPVNIHTILKDFTHQSYHKEGDYAEIYNTTVHPFIKNSIILIAYYNSTKDINVKHTIDDFKMIDNIIKQYFEKINNLMNQYFIEYPNTISYNRFYEIGKSLLTF